MGQWTVDITDSIGQWTISQDSGVNAALTLTKAAVAQKSHHITAIEVAISGAAAANDVTVELKEGATVKWKQIIGSGAPRGEKCGIALNFPIEITKGSVCTLVVSTGGTGVVTSANLAGYTV